VALVVPVAQLLAGLAEIRRSVSARLLLLRRDGVIVAGDRNFPSEVVASINAYAVDETVAPNRHSDVEGHSVEIDVIEALSLLAVVSTPRQAVVDEWGNGRKIPIIAMLLAMVIAVFGNCVIYRLLRRQILRDHGSQRSLESRLRDSIEAMPAGFIVWGPDKRMALWNARVLQLMPECADLFVEGIAFAYRQLGDPYRCQRAHRMGQ
jgi:PAS domain-containing protein